jgi:ELWxxDGT repeat protein
MRSVAKYLILLLFIFSVLIFSFDYHVKALMTEPVMEKDTMPGSTDGDPYNFASIGDIVYYASVDTSGDVELWRSDGTEAGTWQVKEINPSGAGTQRTFFEHNGLIYFTGNDGINGLELWKTDGTESGTIMVKNISPSGNSSPSNYTTMGDTLFFLANDGTHGIELWKTDGTNINCEGYKPSR